jgi:hypothetical protein
MAWYEAIEQPGAAQMQFGRRLMQSRPFLSRIPDDSIIVPSKVRTAVPGAGTLRLAATRDEAGSFAMVYTPAGRPFKVRLDVIRGQRVRAWWYDPRTGKASRIGEFQGQNEVRFEPPALGEYLDWVLVLDDAASSYPPPGEALPK